MNAEYDDDSKDKNDNDYKDHNINNKTPLIVTPGNDGNIAKTNMTSLYPHLLQAIGEEDGFDPLDPSVQKSSVVYWDN